MEVTGRAYLQGVIKQPKIPGATPQESEATVQSDFGLRNITELGRLYGITGIMIIYRLRNDRAQSIDGIIAMLCI